MGRHIPHLYLPGPWEGPELVLTEGSLVFDPNTSRHHHLIDERTGRIYDVPWHHVHVARVDEIEGFDINDYQVLLRGTKE